MAFTQTFRFFDLIPELRNRVYELLFEGHIVDCDASRYQTPGILLASKQAFSEAHGAYYRRSEFRTASSAVAEKRLSILNPAYTPLVNAIHVDMTTRLRDLYGPGQSIFARGESEDKEMFETAYLAQCAVLWLRQGLQEQKCGPFDPHAIKASIKLSGGRIVFTATPFETFRDAVVNEPPHGSNDFSVSHARLLASVHAQAQYFDFDHENPRKCWHRLWSPEPPLTSRPWKCQCPLKPGVE